MKGKAFKIIFALLCLGAAAVFFIWGQDWISSEPPAAPVERGEDGEIQIQGGFSRPGEF